MQRGEHEVKEMRWVNLWEDEVNSVGEQESNGMGDTGDEPWKR